LAASPGGPPNLRWSRRSGHAEYGLAFNADATVLFSGGDDGNVRAWDVGAGSDQPTFTLSGHDGPVFALAFNPRRPSELASAGADKTIRLWEVAARTSRVLKGPREAVLSLAYSPLGDRLVSGSADHYVTVWDPQSAKALLVAEPPLNNAVYAV